MLTAACGRATMEPGGGRSPPLPVAMASHTRPLARRPCLQVANPQQDSQL